MGNVDHPKLIGDRTTLAVMIALRTAGLTVLLPFGEHTRYDLAVDQGTRLARVQCKTGRLRKGAVRFKACSTYAHHLNRPTPSRDYAGQVEYFGVHCPDTGAVYLVPIEALEVKFQGALRVTPALNGQRRRVRMAADFEIGSVLVAPPTSDPQELFSR
jgi:PD-(D/E)XK endonuclease